MSADLWAALLFLGGAVFAIIKVYLSGRAAGRDAVISEQVKKDADTIKEFDAIDRQSPDVSASLKRLRERSTRKSDASPK